MANKNQNEKKGVSGLTLLTIAFIVLKLCKVITWSWGWVLAPIWIPVVLVFIGCIVTASLKK